MTNTATYGELKAEADDRWQVLTAGDRPWIRVGTAMCGQAAGGLDVVDALREELENRGVDAVVSEVEANPLPQKRDLNLHRRDIVVETSSGYTANVQIQDAAISAPKNCQGSVCEIACVSNSQRLMALQDTFLGSKLFTSGPFDTTLCAAACT